MDGLQETSEAIASECNVTFELYRIYEKKHCSVELNPGPPVLHTTCL